MDDDNFPRGDGDPDFYGYPSEHDPTCYINVNGGSGRKCDCSYSEGRRRQAAVRKSLDEIESMFGPDSDTPASGCHDAPTVLGGNGTYLICKECGNVCKMLETDDTPEADKQFEASMTARHTNRLVGDTPVVEQKTEYSPMNRREMALKSDNADYTPSDEDLDDHDAV